MKIHPMKIPCLNSMFQYNLASEFSMTGIITNNNNNFNNKKNIQKFKNKGSFSCFHIKLVLKLLFMTRQIGRNPGKINKNNNF